MEEVVEQLRRVALGLKLVLAGVVAMVVYAVALIAVMAIFLELKNNPAAMTDALQRDHAAVMIGLTALGVLSQILTIAGKVYCISVPQKSAATPHIVMATSGSAIGMMLYVASRLPEFSEFATDLAGAGTVLMMFGYLWFIAFLGQLARFFGSARMRMKARRVLLGSSITLTIVFLSMTSGMGNAVTVLTGLLGLLGALLMFGMYALFVYDMRRLTDNAANYVAEREGLADS